MAHRHYSAFPMNSRVSSMSLKDSKLMDAGKYVRYTPEQVEALERLYSECPKPSSLRRQQLIKEFPILSNIEPKQIKVWFQNRRCREKQRKEASRLQAVNRKLTAMNKLLMDENDRLQKQVSHLVYENGYMRSQIQASGATADNSCESVVITGQQHHHHHRQNPNLHNPLRDSNNPSDLLAIAEETLAEFLSKATGTAVDWVQIIGMKPGPDSFGIVAISRSCNGIAARACGLVSLEPTKVAEILKDRQSWYHDCRSLNVLNVIPTADGGTIELVYMQTYAPTTLASARDFWTLRYSTSLEDGSLVICERSLAGATTGPSAGGFVRAEMLPSGYLIRPCEGGGSVLHIVDHMDLDPWSVPEVLRPLYESSKILAQKMTLSAMRHVRQLAQENTGEVQFYGGRQPGVLRSFSQKLSRGFNDAVNGFADDGWSIFGGDELEDVTISVISSSSKKHVTPAAFGGVLCAKASMLLQDVPPALLVRFLREHRSEWADVGVDAYSASCLRSSGIAVVPRGGRAAGFSGNHVNLPLSHATEQEEFLEVVRLERLAFSPEDIASPRDMYLLQLCNGVGDAAAGTCAQLVFAPTGESLTEVALSLSSGFRVIPLEPKEAQVGRKTATLDLASSLDVGHECVRPDDDAGSTVFCHRSVLTIAFQFTYENHSRDTVAFMARQYVRSIVGSVQRVSVAISPSRIIPPISCGSKPLPISVSPEAPLLARWICRSYRVNTGGELLRSDCLAGDGILKQLWHYSEAILCCSLKMNAAPVFIFANQAGLDMLETTLVALQDIQLDNILDEGARKTLYVEFPKIMQEGSSYMAGGVCMSSMNRLVSYGQSVVWKVLDEDNASHCLAFMFVNWSFV